jgi:hypothetical protein
MFHLVYRRWWLELIRTGLRLVIFDDLVMGNLDPCGLLPTAAPMPG